MKLTRHEINAISPKRAFLMAFINANLKQIIFALILFLHKHYGYQMENSAVFKLNAKIHQITSFLYQ